MSHVIMNLNLHGLGDGMSPVWCQAFMWTKADLLSIGPLGTNFS